MIIAKLSKTIENLTNKKPEVISRDVQTNSNQPTKEPPLWDIMSELSSNSDGIQEEVTESSNLKQAKINLKQQLEQVRLQKKFEYNNYQSQERDKISNDQDIYLPETCVIVGDSILNGLIEENLCDHLLDLNMDILDNRIGQININSIRNKFDLLMSITKNEIDILMISESKIDKLISYLLWQVTQFLSGLIGQVMGVEYSCL